MQCDYVVKAKFWENIYRKAYGFSSGLAIPNHFQPEESRAVGQTLPASTKALEHVGVLLSRLYSLRGGYTLRRSWPTPQDTDTYGVLQSYFKRFFRIGLVTKHRL